jgi:predicted PurR-regulated permease PerM
VSSIPPRSPAGERLRRAGIAAWALIGIAIVVVAFGYLLLKIRVIFPPLVVAVLMIYLLNPLVTRFHQRGIPRSAGTIISFIVFFGILTSILLLMIPFVSDQVSEFSDEWPEIQQKTINYIDDGALEIKDRFDVEIDTTQVDCLLGADTLDGTGAPSAEECDEVTENLRDLLVEQAGRFTEIGRSILEILLVFILGPLIALYLLIDLPQLQRDVLNLVPEDHRDEIRDLGNKIGRAVGGFFRGQLFVAASVGVLSALGFWIIGLPFWLVIGAIAGFFNLIPLIGPYIGGAIGFLVGTLTTGIDLGLKAALVELIVQQIDNHFISPQVMKRTVRIHPATVVLALLAGGTLAGFWGILLAVPAVAVTKIVLHHVWATRVLVVEPSPYARTSARAEATPPEASEVEQPEAAGED